MKRIDETGNRYGKLTVIGAEETIGSRARFLCQCDCGKKIVVVGKNLRTGNTQTCGCGRLKYFSNPGAIDSGEFGYITAQCGAKIKIDKNMVAYFRQFKWRIYGGYAVRTRIKFLKETKRNIFMHHEVLAFKKGMVNDHKNGDKLDNTLRNLRLCSAKENVRNRSLNKNKKSKIPYKGVYFYYRDKNRYVAQIAGTHIGIFNSAKEAAIAYNKKASELYGEYARLNDV